MDRKDVMQDLMIKQKRMLTFLCGKHTVFQKNKDVDGKMIIQQNRMTSNSDITYTDFPLKDYEPRHEISV